MDTWCHSQGRGYLWKSGGFERENDVGADGTDRHYSETQERIGRGYDRFD